MSKQNIFLLLVLLSAFTACQKNKGGGDGEVQADKKVTYAGTTNLLSEGRYSIEVLKTGDYTCFTGGTIFSLVPFTSTPSVNVDVFNQRTNAWTRFGLSIKREHYGAAALNDKLVVAGGIVSTSTHSPVIDIFDLATGQITAKSLSKPRGYLSAAAAGNKMLFAGGLMTGNGSTLSNAVDIYNTQTGQWTTDTISQARIQMAGGAVGNKIVFAGGTYVANGQTMLSDRADIYDVQTGQWSRVTLSQARSSMKVISAGNKLFFYGGNTLSGYAENVDVYDVQANRWTVSMLSGNTLSYLLASTDGSHVTFAYGSNFNYTKLNVYNVATGGVNTVVLPVPTRSSAMAMAGGKLVMPAGVMADTVTRRVIVYDFKANKFDTSSFNLPDKKGACTAAAVGDRIFVAGGVFDGKNAMNQREVINYKSVSIFELK